MAQPIPDFPNLDAFDEVSAILDTANGVCGLLANASEGEGVPTDLVRSAYAIGYIIEAARDKLVPLHSDLIRYRKGRA